jgi:SAM-dependent methyltransferase
MLTAASPFPFEAPWPAGGMESVGACPICGARERELLFAGLEDRIFMVAPGKWDLHRCARCGSGYLDPRPTPDTIGIAYASYPTHRDATPAPYRELSELRRWQRLLANGYKNARFGTRLEPASSLGPLVAFFMPEQRRILDRQFRQLQEIAPSGRVLDIGCGDAGFLACARSIGWEAVGTDIDPVVIEKARRRGFEVYEGIIDGVPGEFDVITVAHVIEHVHDPLAVLRACFERLRPGGAIWIETPNMKALGLRHFGRAWRGLEPPRHLVLFNRSSLADALARVSFEEVKDLPQPRSVRGVWKDSARVAAGKRPGEPVSVPPRLRLAMAGAWLQARSDPEVREYLALTARKPRR